MSDGVGCCGTSMQLWCMVSTAAKSLIATDCPCCRAGVPAVGAGVVLDLNETCAALPKVSIMATMAAALNSGLSFCWNVMILAFTVSGSQIMDIIFSSKSAPNRSSSTSCA